MPVFSFFDLCRLILPYGIPYGRKQKVWRLYPDSESYRDESGHSRHRIQYNLGKAAGYTPDQIQRIGTRLYELGGGELKDLLGITTAEKTRYNYGSYQVYASAFAHPDSYLHGLPHIFSRIAGKHKKHWKVCT